MINAFSFMTFSQIADVQAGTKTLDVSLALQSFFNAIQGKVGVMEPGVYLSGDIFVREKTKLYAENAQIFAPNSLNLSKNVLSITDSSYTVGVQNVKIIGLTVNGNRYYRTTGTRGGAAIYISASKNITLEDCNIVDSHMDGIGIAGLTTWRGGISDNIRLINVSSVSSTRNNLSPTGVRKLYIEGGEYSGAFGMEPQAGIDFEPDGLTNPNIDFTLIGVRANSNYGNGIMFASSPWGNSGRLMGVETSGNGRYGVQSDALIDQVRIDDVRGAGNAQGLLGGTAIDRNAKVGNVIQMVNHTDNTTSSVTGTNYQPIAGDCTVNLKYSNSSVLGFIKLYMESANAGGTTAEADVIILRDGVQIDRCTFKSIVNSSSSRVNIAGITHMKFEDPVGTGNPHYTLQARVVMGNEVIMNRVHMTFMEIPLG